jgi:hypothetical protein
VNLVSGQRILIQGADSWSIGKIEETRTPDRLPYIEGAPPPAEVEQIMRDWNVQRIALISHHGYIFAALQTATGWRDLKGQPLQIEAL